LRKRECRGKPCVYPQTKTECARLCLGNMVGKNDYDFSPANPCISEASLSSEKEQWLKRVSEEAKLMHSALDVIRDAAFMAREDGAFHYVNAAAAKSLGYSKEELLKLTVMDVDKFLI